MREQSCAEMRVRIPPLERSLRAVVSPQLVAPTFSQLTANAGRTTSTPNRQVAGSSPAKPTNFCACASQRARLMRACSSVDRAGTSFQILVAVSRDFDQQRWRMPAGLHGSERLREQEVGGSKPPPGNRSSSGRRLAKPRRRHQRRTNRLANAGGTTSVKAERPSGSIPPPRDPQGKQRDVSPNLVAGTLCSCSKAVARTDYRRSA